MKRESDSAFITSPGPLNLSVSFSLASNSSRATSTSSSFANSVGLLTTLIFVSLHGFSLQIHPRSGTAASYVSEALRCSYYFRTDLNLSRRNELCQNRLWLRLDEML